MPECEMGHSCGKNRNGNCIDCQSDKKRERARLYYRKHKDAHGERTRKYRKRHPDRREEQEQKFKQSHPLYCIWANMIRRCHNPKDKTYPKYGGMGIAVCGEWRGKEGFWRFQEHMGPRPTLAHSVDRIESFLDYEPGNVRWATKREQAENRRTTRFETYQGRRLSHSQWARELGITPHAFRLRLNRGLPPEKVFGMKRGVGVPSREELLEKALRLALEVIGEQAYEGRAETDSLLASR